MKKTILLKFSLALFAMAGWMSAHAQNTVTINAVQDSSFYAYCPTPVQVEYMGWGNASGYTAGVDDMEIHISFGDGSDSTFDVGMWGTTTQNWSFFISHTYTLPGSYTIQVIATAPDGVADTMTYGPVIVSNGCGFIDGYTYIDNNGNCLFDAGDDTLKYVPIQAVDPTTGNILVNAWSGNDGHYSMTVPSGVNVDLETNNSYGLPVTCPTGGTYSINIATGNSATYDFGVTCSQTQYDMATYGNAWGIVPGNNAYIHAFASNFSCLSQGGTMTLTFDSDLTYTGNFYGLTPTSVSGNTITWTVPPISLSNQFYWGMFYGGIQVLTDTTVQLGDTLCFTLDITPTSNDLNLTNNTYSWCNIAVASYDPNEKQVSPIGIGAGGNVHPSNTTFTYTVHFQNTGTYPAEDIYILDTISSNLDMSTLEILGSSHPQLNPIVIQDNIIKFDFQDIWLADSTSNEPASHGHVTYRISAVNGLPHGTQIENSASIYFDYNEPVKTNTTVNTIDFGVGIIENFMPNVKIYPNPANDFIIVQFEETYSGVISIVDMTGRTISDFTINGNQSQVDITTLAPGIYTLVSKGNTVGRVTIQR